MLGPVNVHFQCLPGGTNSKTDLTHESRPVNVFSLHMVLHDRLVLCGIFTVLTAIHPIIGPVHHGPDFGVKGEVLNH